MDFSHTIPFAHHARSLEVAWRLPLRPPQSLAGKDCSFIGSEASDTFVGCIWPDPRSLRSSCSPLRRSHATSVAYFPTSAKKATTERRWPSHCFRAAAEGGEGALVLIGLPSAWCLWKRRATSARTIDSGGPRVRLPGVRLSPRVPTERQIKVGSGKLVAGSATSSRSTRRS